MRTFCRGLLFTAILVAAAVPALAAELIYMKTAQLKWTTNSFTRDFTAAMTDTGFCAMPNDVAWDLMPVGSAAVFPMCKIEFIVTGAVAANADTVHYTFVRSALGIREFSDTRDLTPSVYNTGITNSSARRWFTGFVGYPGNGIRTSEVMWGTGAWKSTGTGTPKTVQLKVQGDPDGALNDLAVLFTYPSRTP